MTIRRFAQWGRIIDRPHIVQQCDSDSQVAKFAADCLLRGKSIPHVHVTHGSLATSLGSSGKLLSTQVRELPIDLLHVSYRTADGTKHASTAANSVVMRRRVWTGEIVVITNSGYWRSFDLAPRAHPNDGVFDVVEISADMTWRQRFIARRRLPQGTHIPHPSVVVGRRNSASWTFAKSIGLYIDDEFIDRATHVDVSIEADALNLVI